MFVAAAEVECCISLVKKEKALLGLLMILADSCCCSAGSCFQDVLMIAVSW